MQSMQEQHTTLPEQRPARGESSPEQRYEKSLHEQKSSDQLPPSQPAYQAGLPPQPSRPYYSGQPLPQQPYQAQPPVIVQNFYQAATPMPTPVMVNVSRPEPNLLLRALWFIFIGWWVGLIWLHIGYALCLTGIFLPVGLVMLNRLPAVLTLRGVNSQQTTITMYQNGTVAMQVGQPPQVDFLVRVVYFLFVGWWLGYLWALAGYFLCFTIVLLPIGVMMLNRLPTILTLRRT
jgi:uncharacterized membrane protein YccF (DUF307 family)